MDGWMDGGEGGRAGGEIDTNLLISRIGQVPLPQMESRLRRDGSIVDVRICSRFDPASNKFWKSSRAEKKRRPPQTKRKKKRKKKTSPSNLSPAPSSYHRPNINSPFPFPSIPSLSSFFNFYFLKTKIHKNEEKKRGFSNGARCNSSTMSPKNAKRRVITHDTKSLPRHGTIPSFPTWRLNEDDMKKKKRGEEVGGGGAIS